MRKAKRPKPLIREKKCTFSISVPFSKLSNQHSRKAASPQGDATTSSEYFGSGVKQEQIASGEAQVKQEQKSSNMASAKPSPKAPKSTQKSKSASIPASTTRVSSRSKRASNYVEAATSDDEPSILKNEDDSADDIFGEDYKRNGKKMNDEYQSSSSEGFEEIKPLGSKVKSTPSKVAKKETSRKRKSEELNGLGEAESEAQPKKAARKLKDKKSPAANKITGSIAKAPARENDEIQAIFDSIPLIRPPTLPETTGDKKFDFRANTGRAQATASAGFREPPTGQENCLAGLTFVFTGILQGLGREEGQQLVKKYGGKVTSSPSSKTSYVVMGEDAGPKKIETIHKLNLKTIDENGLFKLIETMPINGGSGKAAEKFEEKKQAEMDKAEAMAKEMVRDEAKKEAAAAKDRKMAKVSTHAPLPRSRNDQLWTVKYAPENATQVCGNKGQVDKLQKWLRDWRKNAKFHFKKAGADGTGSFRAVMIHGPPGIGKTTAAHLAAKLEGYDVVESNASDTRSKKLVEQGLRGVLDTTSLLGYFAADGKRAEVEKKKLVLIMDEVDGMSAGDRGGVGALAAVCKKTNIPMILICNDRRQPKMKPFDHITYDMPFRKPTTDQVRARIMTILFRENMKDQIPMNVVNALIEGSRADIRQIINMLSTAKLDQQTLDFDAGKKMSNAWEKHIILKPWDIVNKILAGGLFAPASKATLNDKSELYFNDHEISPLMLQENYLGTTPTALNSYPGSERTFRALDLAEKAAASISDGDLVDRMIHGSQQQWSLMPTHAVFSFVRPASFIAGSLAGHGQTRFPTWLGNNSKQSELTKTFPENAKLMIRVAKLLRFIKEIQSHMRLRCSSDRNEIRQQYFPLLWAHLIKRLEVEGNSSIGAIIELMDSYFLTNDDWMAIRELGVGPMDESHLKIESQVKSMFTRTYNQQSHPLPFMKASSVVAPKKAGREKPDLEEAIEDSDDAEELIGPEAAEEEEEEEALDLKKDKYVSAPKKPTARKGKGSKKQTVDDAEDEDPDSEEKVKPVKSKGRPRGGGTGKRGRGKSN